MRSDLDEHEESRPEEGDASSAEGADASSAEDPLHAAEMRATEAEKKAAEYLEAAQRIKADYENYRKRMLKEQTHFMEVAAQNLVESLLPVFDAFDLALSTLDDQIRQSHPAVIKGIELVYAELMGTLAKAGVSRIDEAGVPFDPHIHHALEHEGSAGEDSEQYVLAVLRPGYKIKRHVLRPAEVKVGYRKPAGD